MTNARAGTRNSDMQEKASQWILKELMDKLRIGEIKLREVENFVNGSSNEAAAVRRRYFEGKAGVETTHIGRHTIDLDAAHGARTVNEIGAVQVIVNSAGEIMVRGEYANRVFPIFIAKEEGMLTEGLCRGIGVLNAAGGVTTVVIKDGMARDILVSTSGITESKRLMDWINGCGKEFLEAEFNRNVGNHGRFVEVSTDAVGKDVHIRFVGTTGAANGMNKVTIASSRAVSAMIAYLEEGLGMKVCLVSESGNTCTDKKPAHVNNIRGRGVSVLAEATISREIVAQKFNNLTPEEIVDLNTRKNFVGSAMAGSMGYNAHIANILAGIYTATGQDLAHIISGSQGITFMQVDKNGDLYVTLRMPAIEVATYGGATKNETHKEILQLMGLYGDGDNEGNTRLALAEVVAAACLAGELNLIAVQAAKKLAFSHSSLKRG
ncbi:MAG: 3-hydroxy-3-methylglutaryl-CoA reductase [Candidatus Micrarchaeaceae archaeon]